MGDFGDESEPESRSTAQLPGSAKLCKSSPQAMDGFLSSVDSKDLSAGS
jgi:hypothetical protein